LKSAPSWETTRKQSETGDLAVGAAEPVGMTSSQSEEREMMSYSRTAPNSGRYPDDLATLENLDDWQIVEGEPDPRGYDLLGRNGEKIGSIKNLLASPSTRKIYFAIVETGSDLQHRRYAIPLEQLQFDSSGHKARGAFTGDQFARAPEYRDGGRDFTAYGNYWLAGAAPAGVTGMAAAETPMGAGKREVRVPVTEETAAVRKEQREAGAVVIHKEVETETQHIAEPVTRTRVEVETRAVPAGETYPAGADGTALRDGEVLRIPVVEEELVVEKRPRVTEEVIIRTKPETETVERDVQLRHEHVEVEEEGDVDLTRTPGR
jgi:uncharacterized protein (TIGR02271 family)